MNYTITSKGEKWANGITMITVFNSKSNKEHAGFLYPNGKIEIMVGMRATLKRITVTA